MSKVHLQHRASQSIVRNAFRLGTVRRILRRGDCKTLVHRGFMDQQQSVLEAIHNRCISVSILFFIFVGVLTK